MFSSPWTSLGDREMGLKAAKMGKRRRREKEVDERSGSLPYSNPEAHSVPDVTQMDESNAHYTPSHRRNDVLCSPPSSTDPST
jgi:hypothetical protein